MIIIITSDGKENMTKLVWFFSTIIAIIMADMTREDP